MRFVSTVGSAPPVDFRTALFHGLAPDGGLYIPEAIPPLPSTTLQGLIAEGLSGIGRTVLRHLLGDGFTAAELTRIVDAALDFAIPLVPLDERRFLLELFHGPTLAFKDVGARCMARLIVAYRRTGTRPLTVITATSGDTGGAVAHAFYDLADVRVVVLFPAGQVSPLQRRQFSTLGGNVTAVAVDGTFDDCQRLAKGALGDETLRTECSLTSANSINVGRWLPQAIYYFHAWTQLCRATKRWADSIIVSVPCGNFGNLTAGLVAKRMGLPVTQFVAATNVNDVVPQFLRTGRYRPGPSRRTISSAMDVGDPSNVPRMLALYAGREPELRRDVVGSVHSDDATKAAIVGVYRRFGYLLDPHGAVGYLGLGDLAEPAVGIGLATAHPAKFREVVEPLIDETIALPAPLKALVDVPERVLELAPVPSELEALLGQMS